jgi:thioester reductase-like protein
VSVIAGDLAEPGLRLARQDWEALTQNVRRIYHCGAEVDYVKSYNLLRPANVLATRDIIDLAAAGCRKSLHYVSTTFVFGWSVKPFLFETDSNAAMADLDFGYAQSKWVAEHLVLSAQREGLPATIYRPSLVTASAAARFVWRDITARVLGYMIRHGLTVDSPNQLSFLPVDICARNIVALSLNEDRIAPVLHMTSDDHHTIADICRTISRLFGYQFSEIGLEDFVAHAHAHCTPDDSLYPLLSFLDRNTARILRMGAKRYDSTAYRRARDSTPLAVPHPSLDETVDPIVIYLQREGLIPLSRSTNAGRGSSPAGALA